MCCCFPGGAVLKQSQKHTAGSCIADVQCLLCRVHCRNCPAGCHYCNATMRGTHSTHHSTAGYHCTGLTGCCCASPGVPGSPRMVGLAVSMTPETAEQTRSRARIQEQKQWGECEAMTANVRNWVSDTVIGCFEVAGLCCGGLCACRSRWCCHLHYSYVRELQAGLLRCQM